MPRAFVLHPPAKINLLLHVGAVRGDGFHEVRTLLQSIALADRLLITPRRGPFVLATQAPGVPADRSNLVWRAAARLWREAGREGDPRDAHVRLDKRVPPGAGLGGGSADAAAALVGLNTAWGTRVPRPRLAAIASDLGADVPFFLAGGTVLGVGRGDEVYPLADVSRQHLVIVKPAVSVATAEAYQWFDDDPGGPAASGPAQFLNVGWPTGPVRILNDLQPAVSRRHPAIADALAACRREGASVAAMTGSGSAVFAVFAEGTAHRAARRLRRPDWLVVATRTLTRREAGKGVGL